MASQKITTAAAGVSRIRKRKNFWVQDAMKGPRNRVENIISVQVHERIQTLPYISSKGKKNANLHLSPDRIASCTQNLVFKAKITVDNNIMT